jgi:hypothetical protein
VIYANAGKVLIVDDDAANVVVPGLTSKLCATSPVSSFGFVERWRT